MPPDRRRLAPERVPEILRRLRSAYPNPGIALDFTTPLECVVATVLSAQSTDAKVNQVTKSLFGKYRRPEDYLAVPEEELQRDVHATGFFRQKTRALRGLSQKLVEDFDGKVPRRMADLVSLPGVARKTANIVQSSCFPEVVDQDPDAGIAVDTHVGRLAVRLGLTEHGPKDADKIETDLTAVVPRKEWPTLPYLLIEHGRRVCDAKRPRCGDCVVEHLCPSSQEAGEPDLYRVARSKKKTGKSPRTHAFRKAT
jgi:endonuclease III